MSEEIDDITIDMFKAKLYYNSGKASKEWKDIYEKACYKWADTMNCANNIWKMSIASKVLGIPPSYIDRLYK